MRDDCAESGARKTPCKNGRKKVSTIDSDSPRPKR
tara:strand:- start:208 stop:312 length:105 start_codon:yes stop_codon:yes gene_type:complete